MPVAGDVEGVLGIEGIVQVVARVKEVVGDRIRVEKEKWLKVLSGGTTSARSAIPAPPRNQAR